MLPTGNVPPLFHCFGLVLGNLAAWAHAACIVYPSPIFNAPAIVEAVVGEKCKALHGVPTHFLAVLAEVEKRRSGDPGSESGEDGEQGQVGKKGGKNERREEFERGFERLRTGIAAGAPVPIELMRRLIDELGLVGLTNAYGMSTCSPSLSQ